MQKLWFYKLNYNYLDPGSTHKLNLESGSRSGSSTIFLLVPVQILLIQTGTNGWLLVKPLVLVTVFSIFLFPSKTSVPVPHLNRTRNPVPGARFWFLFQCQKSNLVLDQFLLTGSGSSYPPKWVPPLLFQALVITQTSNGWWAGGSWFTTLELWFTKLHRFASWFFPLLLQRP